MVVIYVSFSLRRRIGVRNWRRLHYLTFAVFGAATVHGLAAGTDRWAFGLVRSLGRRRHRADGLAYRYERRITCTASRSTGRCVAGMASCVKIAPETFDLDDEGIAIVVRPRRGGGDRSRRVLPLLGDRRL